jgi:nucleoside-triphosphatase THEP1
MATSIIVLSGERGVGKSTACRETVALAQAKEYACGGIITLTRPDGELDVLDVSSDDARRLTLPPGAKPAIVQAIVQGRFRFDPETLDWGNAALARGTSCQLLVVDELGPLELEQGGGWTKAFEVLHRGDFTLALVAVRPELVVKAQLRLRASATTVLTVTPEDRDSLPPILLKMLERAINPPPNV